MRQRTRPTVRSMNLKPMRPPTRKARTLTRRRSPQISEGVSRPERTTPRLRRQATSVSLALVLLSIVLGTASLVAPSPDSHSSRQSTQIVIPMYEVSPLLSATAASLGDTRRASNIQAMFSARLTPTDVRTGPCGSSYLLLDPIPRGFRIRTGFSVVEPVASYSWAVDGYGPKGFRTTFTGGASGAHVDLVRNVGELRPGEYRVMVTTPSHVVLSNGNICQSMNPAESKPVF